MAGFQINFFIALLLEAGRPNKIKETQIRTLGQNGETRWISKQKVKVPKQSWYYVAKHFLWKCIQTKVD